MSKVWPKVAEIIYAGRPRLRGWKLERFSIRLLTMDFGHWTLVTVTLDVVYGPVIYSERGSLQNRTEPRKRLPRAFKLSSDMTI